jgi:hypothetical protein
VAQLFSLGDITRMTIDDIAEMAFAGLVSRQTIKTQADAFCQQEQISSTVFLDTFARYIVSGYLDGRLSWISCDTAMNVLMEGVTKLTWRTIDFIGENVVS